MCLYTLRSNASSISCCFLFIISTIPAQNSLRTRIVMLLRGHWTTVDYTGTCQQSSRLVCLGLIRTSVCHSSHDFPLSHTATAQISPPPFDADILAMLHLFPDWLLRLTMKILKLKVWCLTLDTLHSGSESFHSGSESFHSHYCFAMSYIP